MPRRRVAILISGRGSNMAALIEAAKAADYPAEIVLVISSRIDAAGLALAAEAGIATAIVSAKDYPDKAAFEEAIDAELVGAKVEIICLAGFMRLLSEAFVDRWQNCILNIHPSLLPAFRGLNTHARALDTGVRIHGCTVHYVSPEMDEGPIVAQAAVPVLATDTPESLAERVLAVEHQLYPKALALVAGDRARVSGERVIVDGLPPDPAPATLISPPGV